MIFFMSSKIMESDDSAVKNKRREVGKLVVSPIPSANIHNSRYTWKILFVVVVRKIVETVRMKE